MPVHDWTTVEPGIFHAFHVAWIPEISGALNDGLLPSGYYALPEQHAGALIPDILTLHATAGGGRSAIDDSLPPATGGTAVAEAPPKTRHRLTLQSTQLGKQRSVAIRHVSDHRLVALIEVVSPANKDRRHTVSEFAIKAATALEHRVNFLLIDLLPPGRHDPYGMHGAIWQELSRANEPSPSGGPPPGEPLTLAAYAASRPVEAFLEHVAVGAPLPEMPLFVRPDRYVNVPLEPTYAAAYARMPKFWRDVIEGREPTGA